MSGGTQDTASSPVCFLLRDSHTLWSRFPAGSHSNRFGNSTCAVLQPPNASTWVWAVPISLAATIGISVIYFPPGTEMVHFPGFALRSLCIQLRVTSKNWPGSPIRKSLGHGLFAPRQSLSQLTTSFIAFTRLGIHRVPLVA